MVKRMRVHIAGFFYKKWDHTDDAGTLCLDRSETSMPGMICNAVIPFNNTSQTFNVYTQTTSTHTELVIECRKPVEEGYYNFSIWNEKGRTIQQQELWIDKDAKSMNLEVPGMISGDYYLQISNVNNEYAFREKVTIG